MQNIDYKSETDSTEKYRLQLQFDLPVKYPFRLMQIKCFIMLAQRFGYPISAKIASEL